MNLFEKIRSFLNRLFTPALTEQNLLQQQTLQHGKLKSALVNLIFQRKQTEAQLERVKKQAEETQHDLKQAALENRDDLAIHLMQQAETLEAEINFLTAHLEKIQKDIGLAKQTEIELTQKIQTTKRQYSSLLSRQKVLTARKSVHQQLQVGNHPHEEDIMSRVQDKILQIEAENEALDSNPPWQSELDKMRDNRKLSQYNSKLLALKSELKGRQLTYSGNLKPVLN